MTSCSFEINVHYAFTHFPFDTLLLFYCRCSNMTSKKILLFIKQLHARRPIVMNTTTFCLLYAVGDISQQTITRKPKYDFENTARVSAARGFFGGPFYYYWYKVLDGRFPGTNGRTILKKLACDQAVAGIFGTFMFYTGSISFASNFFLYL